MVGSDETSLLKKKSIPVTMAYPVTIPRLASSRSKAEFLERLGMTETDTNHRRLYEAMKVGTPGFPWRSRPLRKRLLKTLVRMTASPVEIGCRAMG